ncbi:MAG TPA: penicillin-binding protein [Bacteroidales bacterium]|nr:MAG: hypothetical protein A2W98_11875 [Bacteroidetes bacterium GWF2_33_38]OFY76468.1 MAG: hypothetical protein A2265_07015 [Bacteroidetes bacterium RIFOXYA12_FULL_33_9]OFY85143.1 MAG: hypothetical protein A2236_12275 [Bacteroidetes bacterium RIFOXYA2_FULL_33_7]HBF89447.1 penicillin-binding protein [Bacteroidales bacterium]
MNFFKFLLSKVFFINLAIAIVVFILFILGAFFALGFYTQHGEAIAVPDFKGLNMKEVEELAENKSLRFEVTDSVYLLNVERGTVVEQSPIADFKVKENRTIFLTMNAVLPERVQMPKLEGITLRQATSILETYGLKVGKLSYVPDIAKNVVLKQLYKGKKIVAGTMIKKGESISLVLGMGESDEKLIVPNITGRLFMDIEEILTSYSLNLGAVVTDNTVITSADSSKARVWKQSPISDNESEINLGSYIDVWITLDTNIIPAMRIDTTFIEND